ncbi:MAG TPA: hypothetical protein DF614_06880 [Methylococcaceae bacterium]|nr:hypothetical protein [Methylococcaceae bacterium]
MIQPVALSDFFMTFFSSALIVLAGACYALLFAWSKVNTHFYIKFSAYLFYCILIVAVWLLSQVAHFSDYWLLLSAVMVIGYFFAPIGIWYLCVQTHD